MMRRPPQIGNGNLAVKPVGSKVPINELPITCGPVLHLSGKPTNRGLEGGGVAHHARL